MRIRLSSFASARLARDGCRRATAEGSPRARCSHRPSVRGGGIATRVAAAVLAAASVVAVGAGGGAAAAGHGHRLAAAAGPHRPAGPPVLHTASDALGLGMFPHTAVAVAPIAGGKGFWLDYADGSVVAAGDAVNYGGTTGIRMNAPLVGMAATPDGHGYWLLGGDGGIFTFGDAGFYGSTGNIRLNRPVVGMAATPDGRGYWLVAADGGIFTFGDAGFYGSTGSIRLNRPVVGMAATPDGRGYWLVAADGGIFTFGDAGFYGSAVGQVGGETAVGIVPTGDGGGYWVTLSNGKVLSFGDAPPESTPAYPTTGYPPVPNNQYSFELTNSLGAPMRWNPCETIHYAVVWPGAPAGWQADVADAIGQVQAATGISFVLDGYYSSSAGVTSPLVIDWKPTIQGGDTVGLATYWFYNLSGYNPQVVKAQIDIKTGMAGGFGPSAEGPVLLHELGHAMGMGHAPGDPEVMNPIDQGFASYQAGDLNGLWYLGLAAGCADFYK